MAVSGASDRTMWPALPSDNNSQDSASCGESPTSKACHPTTPLRQCVPHVFRSLSLDTAPQPGFEPFAQAKAKAKAKAKALRENSSSRHKFISHEADVPVAVAVTACDLVDTPEYVQANPRSHIRLRSMASNWANAHRSRVTFVSAHTGVGVDPSVTKLVADVVARRE